MIASGNQVLNLTGFNLNFDIQLLFEAAYGESPLGASKFAANLKKLSVADVLQYRAAHFVRGNVVVVGNGIAQEQLEAALNKSVSVLPEGPAAALPGSAYVGGDVKVRTDLDGASYFGLAFPVPAGDAGKAYKVLNALVGEKLASQKVNAKNFIHTFAGTTGGIFGVEASAPQHLQLVADELKAIAAKSPEIDAIKHKVCRTEPSKSESFEFPWTDCLLFCFFYLSPPLRNS